MERAAGRGLGPVRGSRGRGRRPPTEEEEGGGGDGRPDSRGLGRRPPSPSPGTATESATDSAGPRTVPGTRPGAAGGVGALGRRLGRRGGRRLSRRRPARARLPRPHRSLGPAERAGSRGTRPGRANRAAFEVGARRSRSEGGHTGAVRALHAPPPACGLPFPPLHHLSFLFVFVSYSKGMTSRRRRENRVQAQKLFPHHHLLKN